MGQTVGEFTQGLLKSGLLGAAELDLFIDALPDAELPQDGEQLARLLVKQKRLTAYQAQQVYSGNGEGLNYGNYVVLDKIGQGGMGLVLKARHRRMDRTVALKVLSPQLTRNSHSIARFQREVRAAAKLNHPNIVHAYDADEAQGTHFLVMEYVEGMDLAALVKQKGPLGVEKAVTCVHQAAQGLHYAHSWGVIHRDVKPSNLLIARDGTVKLLDLGLARLEAECDGRDELTGTGAIVGTVDYMAPEQAKDVKSADARVDIYSLGATLWYLLTGRPMYAGDSPIVKLMAHQSEPVPALRAVRPEVSPELESIFVRMVAKRPAERLGTMAEVAAALERCQNGSAPSVVATPEDDSQLSAYFRQIHAVEEATARAPAPVVRRKGARSSAGGRAEPRRWAFVAAGGVALVALIVAVVIGFSRFNQPRVNDVNRDVGAARAPERAQTSGSQQADASENSPAEGDSTAHGELALAVSRPTSAATDTPSDGGVTLAEPEAKNVTPLMTADNAEPADGSEPAAEADAATERAGPEAPAEATEEDQSAADALVPSVPAPATASVPVPSALDFNVDLPVGTARVELPLGYPEDYRLTVEMYLTPRSRVVGKSNRGIIYTDAFQLKQTARGIELVHVLPNKAVEGVWFNRFRPGRRIHLAAVADGSKMRLFVDGTLVGTAPLRRVQEATAATITLGSLHVEHSDWFPFDGTVDELRISNVPRYSKPFKPEPSLEADPNSLAVYHFDDGSGEVLTDSSDNGFHGRIIGARWVPLAGESDVE